MPLVSGTQKSLSALMMGAILLTRLLNPRNQISESQAASDPHQVQLVLVLQSLGNDRPSVNTNRGQFCLAQMRRNFLPKGFIKTTTNWPRSFRDFLCMVVASPNKENPRRIDIHRHSGDTVNNEYVLRRLFIAAAFPLLK